MYYNKMVFFLCVCCRFVGDEWVVKPAGGLPDACSGFKNLVESGGGGGGGGGWQVVREDW